jgi:hypothetical protein
MRLFLRPAPFLLGSGLGRLDGLQTALQVQNLRLQALDLLPGLCSPPIVGLSVPECLCSAVREPDRLRPSTLCIAISRAIAFI